MQPIKLAYYRQRDTAKKRGVSFDMSYEDWLDVWVSSGHLNKRGRGKGKYCMMRLNDKGAYTKNNVTIGLFEDNTRESKSRNTTRNYPKTTLPPLERLYEKVVKITETGCHIWIGNTVCGYGQTSYLGKRIGTHRLSYLLLKGEIPDGKIVCHSCDVPSCLNPEHLFLGTPKTNAEDKVSKGRQIKNTWTKGENHPSAKLTIDDVLTIRKSISSYAELCMQFGVTKSSISKIKNHLVWKNI
jgi:HNH endonuclease